MHCWRKKILSMGDKVFILLSLISYYGKRWLAELVKTEKMVRKKWFLLDYQGSNQLTDYFCYRSKQKMCTLVKAGADKGFK